MRCLLRKAANTWEGYDRSSLKTMMREDLKKALTSNHQTFRANLIVANILPDLSPYLTEVEYLRVAGKREHLEQVDELLWILRTKEDRHFYGLCRVCERNGYQHLALRLREDAGVSRTEDVSDTDHMAEKRCLYYVDIQELNKEFYQVLLKSVDTFVTQSSDEAFQRFRREAERVILNEKHVTVSRVKLSRDRLEFLDQIQDALWESNLEYRPLREVIMGCEDEGLMKQLQQYENQLRAKGDEIIYHCKKEQQRNLDLYIKLKAKDETTLGTLRRMQEFLVNDVGLDDAIFAGFQEGCIELYFKLSPQTSSISIGPLLSKASLSKLLRLGVSMVELSGHWMINTASGRITYLKGPQNECCTEDNYSDVHLCATQHKSHVSHQSTEGQNNQGCLLSERSPLDLPQACPPHEETKLISTHEILQSSAATLKCSPEAGKADAATAMAKGPPPPPPVTVAVIGLPSSQNERIGSGKSCICDRFLHPGPDEYTGEHSVLLTQQDYSSSVVNSTNFLYWGYQDLNMGGADEEGRASGGRGTLCRLHLIEHTEFIDTDKGQPFHSAQPYMKRVCNTKVLSKGKMAYISLEQLSLPESFPDAPKLPDKLAVDAFILCVDASADFSDGSIQRQFLNKLVPELIKTKKPYVLAITKCDIASPEAIKAVSEFASKQKKQPPVVEVSALHGGINVSTAILLAAHHGNQKFGIPKPKNPSFADEKKVRDELVATAKENLTALLKNVATEFDMKPPKVFDLIIITPEGKEYVRLQGTKATKTVICHHLSSLRNAKEVERQGELMKKLHEVLKHCVPKLEPLLEGESQDLEDEKERMLELVTSHEKYESFFLDDVVGQKKSQASLPSSSSPLRGFAKLWCCDAVLKKEEERIPWSFLMMKETEKLLLDYTMEAKQRALDEKLLAKIDKALQSSQDDILPGTSMEEAFQLAGCSSEGKQVQDRLDLQRLYNAFNRNLEVKHGQVLQELFLEFPELFMLEEGTKEVDVLKASHEKIKEIHEELKDNERYQLLDGRANFRQSMLLKHSAVLFTKKGTLMEDPVQPVLDQAAFRVNQISPSPNGEHIHSLSWLLDPNDAYFNLALVGQRDDIGKLRQDIKSQCSSTGRLEIGKRFCYPNMELFDYLNFEDIAARFTPHCAIFVIDSHHSLKWLDGVVQRMCALSDNHQLQSLVGMPLVILALGEEFMNENSVETQRVIEASNRLQCGLLCEHRSAIPTHLLHPPAAAQLLKLLVLCVDRTTQILQPIFTPGLANLSISLCALPGDPYNMADMLGVWLHQPLSWYHEEHHQQVLQVFLWERATFVHIALKSHSLINTSKIRPTDSSSPIHGYVLVYCTARKASFANAKHLIQKVLYSIPTLLVGIPPSATDRGQPELINEGRMLAEEKENVHFIFADGENWKPGCLNSFYLLCYDRKLSSVQMQRPTNKKLSTRDLPQLPQRDVRSVSPADARPAILLPKPQSNLHRHSMHLGATMPLPRSVDLPQEGDTAGIQPTTDSDEEEMVLAAEIGNGSAKIKLPSGDNRTVPPFRRLSAENLAPEFEDDDKMYMLLFQAKDSSKPNPSMLVNLKTTRSVSLQNQHEFSQVVDSDYAEPINSLRLSPRPEKKTKGGNPKSLFAPPVKSGSVENIYAPIMKKSPQKQHSEGGASLPPPSPSAATDSADTPPVYVPIIKQPKKTPPKPPERRTSLGMDPGSDAMYAIPDKPKPKPKMPPPKLPTQTSSVSGKQDEEVMYVLPEKLKVGAMQNSPSSPSTQHVAKVLTEAESSRSPKTKKKGGSWRRNAKSEDDTPTTTESTPPASPNSFFVAQDVAKKAKTLPRDGFKHLEKQPFQALFEASGVSSRVQDHHDSGRDSAEPPELSTRGYLSDEAEDDAPELPPREYNWSDLESDGDGDEDDDDAGGNEEILQKVYDSLAKFGGPSKETEKLYDTLEQYQKTLIARKQITQQPGGATGYGEYDEVVRTNTSQPSKQSEACLYETVMEVMRTVPPPDPAPPPPPQTTEEVIVSNLSDKQLKQRLKLMKRAVKEMERQQRLEKKKEKRDEELRKKEEKLKKAMKSSMKRKGQKDKAAPQKKSYFGSELTDITTEDNQLPVFVVRCIEVVDKDGLDVEGIYRLPVKQDEVVELYCKFDNDHNLDMAALNYDVTTVSSALKAFFKLLPSPLFPDDITQGVLSVFASEDGSGWDQRLTKVLLKMPRVNLKILAYLCQHLHRISLQSAVNRMSSSNLAIVFWPTLMRPPIMDLANPSQQLKWQKVMTTLIDKPDIVPDPDLEGAD